MCNQQGTEGQAGLHFKHSTVCHCPWLDEETFKVLHFYCFTFEITMRTELNDRGLELHMSLLLFYFASQVYPYENEWLEQQSHSEDSPESVYTRFRLFLVLQKVKVVKMWSQADNKRGYASFKAGYIFCCQYCIHALFCLYCRVL